MLHIFLLFECMPTPVKYYGSCFSSPKTSTIIGILGILGILVCLPLPPVAGLLALTSFLPQSFATSQSQKLQPSAPFWPLTCPVLRPTAASGQNSAPRFAPLRRRPAPSFGRRQPAATLRYAPLRRIIFNSSTTPVQNHFKTRINH